MNLQNKFRNRTVFKLMKKSLIVAPFCFFTLVCAKASWSQEELSQPLFEYSAINHPVSGRAGMVASHNVLSSEIAAEILALSLIHI